MMKTLLNLLLMLLCASAFADASMASGKAADSFLLNAPGTLTGAIKGETAKPATQQQTSTLPKKKMTRAQQPPARYRYIQEGEHKFRQFGQSSGNNNPWFEPNRSAYPRPPRAMMQYPITNPWQLGGMSAPPVRLDLRSDYSMTPYSRYSAGAYLSQNPLFPDYPDGIYRDTNPALLGAPATGGFLPGFGGNNFSFPFSPFGMF